MWFRYVLWTIWFKHILDVSSTTSNRKAEKILKDEGRVVGKSAIALLLAENKSN